jgi:hypothetical protein
MMKCGVSERGHHFYGYTRISQRYLCDVTELFNFWETPLALPHTDTPWETGFRMRG